MPGNSNCITCNGNTTSRTRKATRPAENEVICKQIDENFEAGILKKSSSPWSTPIVLARKKDRTWWMCVDYWKLNQLTTCDVYPIPRIDETLEMLAGAQWFMTLDLLWGFWQIPLVDGSKPESFVGVNMDSFR